MKKRKICVVTSAYPTQNKPFQHTFIDELICGMVDNGMDVIVISPIKINSDDDTAFKRWEKKTKKGNAFTILMPRYISLSNKKVGPLNLASLSLNNYTKAVNIALKKLINTGWKPDIIYGHFLYISGLAAAKIGEEFSIPVICAVGEGQPRTIMALGPNETRKRLQSVSGFIAVSQWVKEMLLSYEITSEDRISVIPNGVDLTKFYPINKQQIREELNLPLEKFIVIFVGRFIDQKGVLRVSEAINQLDDIGALLLGKGNQNPTGENILFKGTVAHNDIPKYLGAADVFVLPTEVEGCCNSIIEAMACGLPIISSTGSFNDDILNESCSIRLDPRNINEIKESIYKLKVDEKSLKSMSEASLNKAKQLDLNERVKKVLAVLESRLENFEVDN